VRVALCHPFLEPTRGGCETYIAALARRLARDGHDVRLHAWRCDPGAVPANARWVAVPEPSRYSRARRPWLFSLACLRTLREDRPDVSVSFDKMLGQDVLYPQGGLHDATARHNRLVPRSLVGRARVCLAQWRDPAYWSFHRLERRQYEEGRSLVVVNSRMVLGHVQARFALPAERLRLLPAAIDPGRFVTADRASKRAEARRGWGLSPGAVVAAFVAMNYSLKGLGPLLRAVGVVRDPRFRLLVVGHPDYRVWQARACRLGVADRVRFIGHTGDVKRVYFASDFLVHPTFYDPCSLVVLEALACGLPVITTRHNGASEHLTPPADGIVLDDPHDAAALSAALDGLCDDGRREVCARAALRAAARWTFEDHYRGLLAILHEAADVRRRRRTAA
jgi:UDP-glucose:(heptosyl)LPS alpha-1,3-glucosyltransferase